MRWLSGKMPTGVKKPACEGVVRGIGISLRAWELLVITLALQLGMLPLMARDFHRITTIVPVVNLVAVPLTGIIVPLGFLALGSALVVPANGPQRSCAYSY